MEWGTTDAEKKKHLLRKSTSPLGIVNEYTYDAYGNALTSKTSKGTDFMQTKSQYDATGNHVVKQTDARGQVVTREVNTTLDTLTSVTDPKGQKVSYTYDQNRKVTKTEALVGSKSYTNKYTYAQDKLMQVRHNTSASSSGDVVYNFTYDELGRPKQVKVGNQMLSETFYNITRYICGMRFHDEGRNMMNTLFQAIKHAVMYSGGWYSRDSKSVYQSVVVNGQRYALKPLDADDDAKLYVR